MDDRRKPMTENLLFALLLAAIVAAETAPMAANLQADATATGGFAATSKPAHS